MPEPLPRPSHDPTPIFEAFRGSYATELLVAAVAHFDLFERLAVRPKSLAELRGELELAERPAIVLTTALRAMGLLTTDADGRLGLTPLAAEQLLADRGFDITGYLRLRADSPGVVEMVEHLRSDRPAGSRPDEQGAAFIYRTGVESAMEKEASARRLTLALAGRARNVAPRLAEVLPLDRAHCLLDVGGGTGIYAIGWLRRHAHLRAVVWDRPEVTKIAREMAVEYGVAERLSTYDGDMFSDEPPAGCDAILLSNVLHDWDVPLCRLLVGKCAAVLPPGGQLLIHDVLLDDDLSGPLPVALYSAALFTMTEGRAYSAAEFSGWMRDVGLIVEPSRPTLVHCAVLVGRKPAH
jgi:SAM-dependent methyltransferase